MLDKAIKANGNSFTGSGLLAPSEDPMVRSLPPALRWGIPGYQAGWPAF